MLFEKARDILRLADMAMSQRMGVNLRETEEEFGIAKRTTQRMMQLCARPCTEVTQDWFERAPDFGLTDYAEAAFGSHHNPQQVGEVVWRFSEAAADRAENWQFHPKQVLKRL